MEKKLLIISIVLSSLILTIILLNRKELKKKCLDCSKEIAITKLKEKIDLNLKFDCNNKMYQPLHLDMINVYGIFGQIKEINSSPEQEVSLSLLLKEAGNCKKYYIQNAAYSFVCIDSTKTPIENIHFLNLTINKRTSDDQSNNFNIEKTFPIKPTENNFFDVYVETNDTGMILPNRLPIYNCITPKPVFGNNICRSAVIFGDN